MNNNDNLIEALANSQMYHDYERAYNEATGLPVTLGGGDQLAENCRSTASGKKIRFAQ